MTRINGSNLRGHLLNSNGVVTADYEVQVHFATAEDLSEIATPGEAGPEIGTPEYVSKYHTPELLERLQKELPRGFKPEPSEALIRIPATAASFLTPAESGRLATNATLTPVTNPVPQIAAQRVILLLRAGIPDVLFLIDWRNATPNLFAFSESGQRLVVVTGGFLRIDGIYADLVLIALASMAVRQAGQACACESDYQAVAYSLRAMLSDETFAHIMMRGVDQSNTLFGLVGDDGAPRTPAQRCHDPGIDCRKQAIISGLSFGGVPDCGTPPVTGLALVGARLDSQAGTRLLASFNDALETSSAETAGNYKLTPEGQVSGAKLSAGDPTTVELTVSALKAGAMTVLSVSGVVSRENVGLLPGEDRLLVKGA